MKHREYRFAGLLASSLLLLALPATRAYAAANIEVSPSSMSFTGQVYSIMAGQDMVISNSGDAALNFSVTSNVFWLSVSNTSGTIPPGGVATCRVNVATFGLKAQPYGGILTVSDPAAANNPRTVFVTLTPSIAPLQHVVGWGYNDFGQATIPTNLTNVVGISAPSYQSMVLKANSTLAMWGWNGYGQQNIPAGLSNITAFGGGSYHSLAVTTGGTVMVWGNTQFGQGNIPAGLSNVMSVAGARYHSLAVKADGTVAAWGYNGSGQTSVPPDLSNVVAVACNDEFSLALRGDGTVAAWGRNDVGQATVPVNLSNVVDVSAGVYHAMALKTDGTVVAWGYNNSGQTNVPSGLTNVVAISCGADHNMVLKADGTVVTWGENSSGQTSLPPGLSNAVVVAIAAGGGHSLALTERPKQPEIALFINNISITGQVSSVIAGQTFTVSNSGDLALLYTITTNCFWLSVNSASCSLEPGATTTHVVNVSTRGFGPRSYLGVLTISDPLARNNPVTLPVTLTLGTIAPPGKIVAWGQNNHGQTNVIAELNDAIAVGGGYQHSLALKADGTVRAWGNDTYGQANVPAGLSNVIVVVGGYRHSLAVLADRTVVAWGDNSYGQASVPSGLSNVLSAAGGIRHSLALKGDGRVVAWGDNTFGQTNVPVGLTDAVAIDAGWHHSVALKANGSMLAWGMNSDGQSTIPADLSNLVAVAAGGFHSLALKADGSVAAWGYNAFGQTNVPAGLTNVVAIAGGYGHSLALKANGSVVVWGRSVEGQTNVPIQLTDNVVTLAGGGNHALALAHANWLTVSSYGTPTPGTGMTAVVRGSSIDLWAPMVVTNGGTQYVNAGWSGMGSIPPTGTTNSLLASITNDSSIMWSWNTSYWFNAVGSMGGSVTPTSGWISVNSNLTLTAAASNNWHFGSWTGTIPLHVIYSNPATWLVTGPVSVVAVFDSDLTSNQIPISWFMGHGWTSNFETISLLDSDSDGFLNWEEYIAASDPTNGASLFTIITMTNLPIRVQISSSTGRVYSLDAGTSLSSNSWAGVAGQTNISGNGGILTLSVTNSSPTSHFYRVRVSLPQ